MPGLLCFPRALEMQTRHLASEQQLCAHSYIGDLTHLRHASNARVYVSVALLLTALATAFAEPLEPMWMHTYLNGHGDICAAVRPDGDLLLLAGCRSDSLIMFMWLDQAGNLMDTAFVPIPHQYVLGMSFTETGSVLFGSGSTVYLGDSIHVGEVETSGVLRWYMSYRSADTGVISQAFTDVCRTTTGDFVAVGSVNYRMNPACEGRYWVAWMDSLGNIFREQIIDPEPLQYDMFVGVGVAPTGDGGVIVSGAPNDCIQLLKLDANGEVAWMRWHCNGNYYFVHVNRLRMGGESILVTGESHVWGGGTHFFLLNSDSLGNLHWWVAPGTPGVQYPYDLIRSTEGRYLVVGGVYGGVDMGDPFMASLEPSGELHDYVQFETDDNIQATGILQLGDSTLVLAGDGYPSQGFWAARLMADSRVPSPPQPFDLCWPPNGDTLAAPGSALFRWRAARDADPLDTVSYRLDVWSDQDHWNSQPVRDTVCLVPDSAVWRWRGGWLQWQVWAHSSRPDTSVASIETRSLFLVPSSAPQPAEPLPASTALVVYPNPFNATTLLTYRLSHACPVTLRIFDVAGREVTTLVQTNQAAGEHHATWNAEGFSSGTYFVRLQAGEFSQAVKIVLMK